MSDFSGSRWGTQRLSQSLLGGAHSPAPLVAVVWRGVGAHVKPASLREAPLCAQRRAGHHVSKRTELPGFGEHTCRGYSCYSVSRVKPHFNGLRGKWSDWVQGKLTR